MEDNKSIFAGYIGNYQDLMPKRLNDDNVFKHKYFSCFLKEPENKYIVDLIEKKNIKITDAKSFSLDGELVE